MSSHIKRSLRSLDSFGVSGVLSEDAIVYYTTLFNTRQIGRISDLIMIRLNPNLGSELRLRTLLVFAAFQAFRTRNLSDDKEIDLLHTNEGELEQPLLIEVGTGQKKLAISVCFDLREGVEIDFKNIAERVYNGESTNSFERLLIDLYCYCDHLLLRYQESTRRAELISIIASEAGLNGEEVDRKERLQIVILSQFMLTQAPKPRAYIDLGDLNYANLLHEDEVKGVKQQKNKEEGEKKGSSDARDSHDLNDAEDLGREDEESSSKEDDDANTNRVVKGSSSNESSAGDEVLKVSGKDQPESKGRGFTSMLGVSAKEGSSESEARKLILEIQAGRLDNIVKRGDADLPGFRKDINNPEAVKFVEALFDEVRKAKDHLSETAGKLDYSIRVRESSFKSENEALQKELKRKDANLVQKNQSMLKLKQEMIEVTNQLERLKKTRVGTLDGDSLSKQKTPESDRNVLQLKEENRALNQRFEALQAQLNAIQMSKNSAVAKMNERLEAAKEKIALFHRKEQEQKRVVSRLLAEMKTLKKNASEEKQNSKQNSSDASKDAVQDPKITKKAS